MGGFPFLSAVLVAASVATLFLAVVGIQRREKPGAATFSVLAIAIVGYTGLYGVSLQVPAGQTRAYLGALQWVAIAFLPVAWLLFALEYSGRAQYLHRGSVLGLSVVPVVTFTAAFAYALPLADTALLAQYGDLFYRSTSTVTWQGHTFVSHQTGPLYLLFLAYSYVCFLVGIGVLFEFVVRFDKLYTQQAGSILVGALFPWVGNVVTLLQSEPIPGLDLLPFFVPVAALMFANAVFRHDLFVLTPTTKRKGESTVVAEMQDAVVVVDEHSRVVDLNGSACERFDVTASAALGEPLPDVAGVSVDDGTDRLEVERESTVYEVRVSPVHDRRGTVIGRTLVFRDITEYRDAQQRLEVLNRVLRHNLRTEVNVISGYASMVESRLPEADAPMATEIATAAGTLDELGQKAREVERIVSRDGDADTYLLGDLLDGSTTRVLEKHDDLRVDVETPAREVRLNVDAVVFEAVVTDLVEALAHYSDDDVISVSVTVSDRNLTVRASEDGDGIPASEYEVVRRGEETPLEHASGLSLWLVKWGVRSLGGDVTFDDGGDAVLDIADCVVATESSNPDGTVGEN